VAYLDEFVEKNFVPPRQDEIMVDGSNLKNGMRVLIADPESRVELHYLVDESPSPMTVFTARKYNRWCTVSNVRRTGSKVSFTGTYNDGAMYRHSTPHESVWYVTRDSMTERNKKKRTEIREILKELAEGMDTPDYEGSIDRIYGILDVR
jgi:hypothetical protein